MAKIEMDVSEYEAMKKVEKLLSEALGREKELSDQIKALNSEKIKILEAASMRVVKVIKNESRQFLYSALSRDEMVRRLAELLSIDTRYIQRELTYVSVDKIANTFFNKGESTTTYDEPTTTTHGLDEIKAEIKAEMIAERSAEDERKIKKADEIISKNYDFENKIGEKDATIYDLECALSVKQKQVNECMVEITELKNELMVKTHATDIIDQIREILAKGNNLFNRSRVLNHISLIVKAK